MEIEVCEYYQVGTYTFDEREDAEAFLRVIESSQKHIQVMTEAAEACEDTWWKANFLGILISLVMLKTACTVR